MPETDGTTSETRPTPLVYGSRLIRNGKNITGGGEDFGWDGVDVGVGGAVVDDTGAETEFGLERCVGEIDAAVGDDSLEDIEIHPIEFGFRQILFAYIPKTDGAEFHGGEQFKFGRVPN